MTKKKRTNREGDTIGLVEVTVQGSCLMETDASREAFGFIRYVIGSKRGSHDAFQKNYDELVDNNTPSC